jgi:hypothetical protein
VKSCEEVAVESDLPARSMPEGSPGMGEAGTRAPLPGDGEVRAGGRAENLRGAAPAEVITIASAAIRQDGKVHTGKRHDLIIHAIYAVTGKRVTGEQGFVTSAGDFVDREEAARIAIAAGQITKLSHHSTKLFSEELPRS